MFDFPASLHFAALDQLCDNIAAAYAVAGCNGHLACHFGSELCVPATISERILENLCEKGKLTDETLLFFDPSAFQLKKIWIKDASPLTSKGLRMLRQHHITHLDVVGLKQVSVNDLIGCLGEWSLNNLKVLNVSHGTFSSPPGGAKYQVVISLSTLKNLTHLNVSHTKFGASGLELVTSDLPNLVGLDISNTRVDDLKPLHKMQDRLEYLSIYQTPLHKEGNVDKLRRLRNLRFLDISEEALVGELLVNSLPVESLLVKLEHLHWLESLDISGRPFSREDSKAILESFVEQHVHLRFLGLVLCKTSDFHIFGSTQVQNEEVANTKLPSRNQLQPAGDQATQRESPLCRSSLVIAGEENEGQIAVSLHRYLDRFTYLQKCLFHLFELTQTLSTARNDLIKLVLPVAAAHPKELGLQLSATACLYNLCRGDLAQQVHPSLLRGIIMAAMRAMENFPEHQQLQKNALITLCSDRILHEVRFDHFRCMQLVMQSLCEFDVQSMTRMSVAIVSILAAKVPTWQTSQIGGVRRHMRRLLDIVRTKCLVDTAPAADGAENGNNNNYYNNQNPLDVTLKFTLSTLWNLTDESPSTCELFILLDGLNMFLNVVEAYECHEDEPSEGQEEGRNCCAKRVHVQVKVLGLLNNVAEVHELRHHLMFPRCLRIIRRLLLRKNRELGYFAAGILSHLASSGQEHWSQMESLTARDLILRELGETVAGWGTADKEMVAYRSFKPFEQLLSTEMEPEIQLWALYAISHVCSSSNNARRYSTMLLDSFTILNAVRQLSTTADDSRVRHQATAILSILDSRDTPGR